MQTYLPTCPERTTAYQAEFKILQLQRKGARLATSTDRESLRQLKEQILSLAECGPVRAADNLKWIFEQLEVWDRNEIRDNKLILGLLEENYQLKVEAQIELRRKAELVLATAENPEEKQNAAATIEMVNEWLALSVETLEV